MAFDDTAIIVALSVVAAIAIAACVALILLMRKRTPKPAAAKPQKNAELDSLLAPSLNSSPFRVTKSVQSTEATQAKDELRILDLEREIVADAIRHLYEAQAEGKITEAERERLASSYKNRMMTIKDSMAKDEGIVALHELESMQEDLMKMFSERFSELTGKVEELRTRIDVKPIREIKVQMPKAPVAVPDQLEEPDEEEAIQEAAEEKEKPKKPKKPPAEKQKTEAEQRIDAIRNQIDEVMNKLGQMEMDS
jgi:MFS superfamily sulfate permease-like transporter